MSQNSRATLLEATHLSKSFSGVKALNDVSLTVDSGEIVAVVGHNGSGKSTLVKILAGVYEPDPGAIIRLENDGDATGLHFIHQDLGLVGSLNAVENLDLARSHKAYGLMPTRGAEKPYLRNLLKTFGFDYDVTIPVEKLNAAERSVLAIARALDAWTHVNNVLVLDEPTVALHRSEVGQLFTAIENVAERGAGVVFISHRLDEIFALSHRVVVLRNGRIVADLPTSEIQHEDLADLVAGVVVDKAKRPATPTSRERSRSSGQPVMSVRGLKTLSIRDLDFDLHAGEILGVAGVRGSGREDVAAAVFGACVATVDEFTIDGHVAQISSPRKSIENGIMYVPSDRHRQGAVMTMSAIENITLPWLRPLLKFGWVRRSLELKDVRRLMSALQVIPPKPDQMLSRFSGGNQQKVVLAKWLRMKPKVLLLDEPVQGVDIGAKLKIFNAIIEAANDGASFVVSSSDSRELLNVCGRVIVLNDGILVADLEGSDLTEEALIQAEVGRNERKQKAGAHS